MGYEMTSCTCPTCGSPAEYDCVARKVYCQHCQAVEFLAKKVRSDTIVIGTSTRIMGWSHAACQNCHPGEHETKGVPCVHIYTDAPGSATPGDPAFRKGSWVNLCLKCLLASAAWLSTIPEAK